MVEVSDPVRNAPVRVERQDRVTIITIDRPERRNAVDHATLLALLEAQKDLSPETRVVVLTGAAPAFSAGADLNGVENDVFTTDLSRVLRGFTDLDAVVLGAIDGPALGAGTQLASVCDLRVATAHSTFGIPAARLGLAVDLWTINRLRDEFGLGVARAMLLAAETYLASALLGGAVHRIGDFEAAVTWAHEIAALAPLTLSTHKRGLGWIDDDLADDGGGYVDLFNRVWASQDAIEGRAAFLEKRPPRFAGS